MIVMLTAPVFDLDGHVEIRSASSAGLGTIERRNSRVATLDGSAEINDFGFSDADRTLDIEWQPESQHQIDTVSALVRSYSRLIVSCQEGCFLGAPGPFVPGDDKTTLRILIERRLDT